MWRGCGGRGRGSAGWGAFKRRQAGEWTVTSCMPRRQMDNSSRNQETRHSHLPAALYGTSVNQLALLFFYCSLSPLEVPPLGRNGGASPPARAVSAATTARLPPFIQSPARLTNRGLQRQKNITRRTRRASRGTGNRLPQMSTLYSRQPASAAGQLATMGRVWAWWAPCWS